MSLNLDKSAWKRVAFGDVVNRSREQADPFAGDVDRYVAGGHIQPGKLLVEQGGDVNDGQVGSTFTYAFHPGQVLFVSASWYLRKVGVAMFDGVVADKTYVMETKDPESIDQRFLPWILLSDDFHAYAAAKATGSMNARLLWRTLANYEFDLPPLVEQQRIADLMWTLERHRGAIKAEIDTATAALRLVRATWVNDQSAKRVKASDAFEFSTGVRRTPDRAQGPHMTPYLRSANVGYGVLDLNDVLEMNYEPSEQARFSLQPGDVLVTEGSASASAVGMPARWNDELAGPVCFQMTLIRIRAIPDVCIPEFVFHWSMWAYESRRFLDVAGGTNIKHISALRSSQMPVQLPSLEAQRQIVAVLETMTTSVESLQVTANKLECVRSSLLGDIFGGAA